MALGIIKTLLRLPIDIIITILRYYLLGGVRSRRYRNSLINSIKLRVFRTSLNTGIMDSKYLGPYSNSFLIRRIVPLFASLLVKGVPGYGEKYDDNSIWLAKLPNRKPGDPVIIYSHGGGYFIQTMPSQIVSLMSLYHLLDDEKRQKTSILFLDYKLVSHGYSFPTQLNQLHDTYSKLVSQDRNNIILMGDSAGGHLSVAYTQFLKTLDQTVVYPKQLVLVSPWVKLNPLPGDMVQGKSWFDNQHYDLIHHSTFARFLDLCLIVGSEDLHSLVSSPGGKVPKLRSDWSDIPTYSDPDYSVFIVLGEDESFRDDILEWAKYSVDLPWYLKVKYGDLHKFLEKEHYEFERKNVADQANLTVFVEPLGVHDAFFFFEDSASSQISKNIKAAKQTILKDLDQKEYFTMVRLTRFLNETL